MAQRVRLNAFAFEIPRFELILPRLKIGQIEGLRQLVLDAWTEMTTNLEFARNRCASTTNTYNTLNCSVGTVKKSMEINWPTWLVRKVFHVSDGSLRCLGIKRETVRSEISTPSLRSSPWIRGAPQSGLAAAMFPISLRISDLMRGRPGLFDRDNLHQYRLNRLRCHEITVSGRTITRADFQFFQIVLSPTVPSTQPRTFQISLEDGQLLTKCRIFQCDVRITTKHKNDESNPSQNCVQHEKQLCRHLMEEATVYSRMGFWRRTRSSWPSGVPINKDVVRRILAAHYHPSTDGKGLSWLTFLGHMKDSLYSIDLFRCESAALQTHWVLVVMDQYTRRIIGFGIHVGIVDGRALCRMFNRAIRGQTIPKYLSSDHDPLYRVHQWQANLRVLGITEIKTVPYVPISHPFVERLIGTIRREYLDRTLFWTAVDLESKLSEFKDYYNRHRTHASLAGKTPEEAPGVNVCVTLK